MQLASDYESGIHKIHFSFFEPIAEVLAEWIEIACVWIKKAVQLDQVVVIKHQGLRLENHRKCIFIEKTLLKDNLTEGLQRLSHVSIYRRTII